VFQPCRDSFQTDVIFQILLVLRTERLNSSTRPFNSLLGLSGNGTLNIKAGGEVSGMIGYLGDNSGSTGMATITDTGSKWSNSFELYVGYIGNGAWNIKGGGEVSNSTGYLGYNSNCTGAATVAGMGSTWSNSGTLYVGRMGVSGKGTLKVVDSGKVIAKALSVNNQSSVKLNVSGNNMLVLGDATTTGTLNNNGNINFYASAFLPTGIYSPISAYPGKSISLSGTGTYNAYGGTWDNMAKTFTATAPTAINAGDSDTVTTAERLLFTDTSSGKRTGANFGVVTGTPTFSATWMTAGELSALAATPGFEGTVLAAWDYTTNFTGGQVMLSYDIDLTLKSGICTTAFGRPLRPTRRPTIPTASSVSPPRSSAALP
jgi:fibronectin-binding autotransporter adhesin